MMPIALMLAAATADKSFAGRCSYPAAATRDEIRLPCAGVELVESQSVGLSVAFLQSSGMPYATFSGPADLKENSASIRVTVAQLGYGPKSAPEGGFCTLLRHKGELVSVYCSVSINGVFYSGRFVSASTKR